MYLNNNNPIYSHMSKTKLMLLTGLLDLMEKKDFSTISITELCQHAKVGRKTYYRHYNSKHDILTHYLHILMLESIDYMNKRSQTNLKSILNSYFHFWQSYSDLIKHLRKHQLCYLMILVCENYFEGPHLTDNKMTFLTDMPRTTAVFIFSGATRIVQKWIYDDMKISASEMADELYRSIQALI